MSRRALLQRQIKNFTKFARKFKPPATCCASVSGSESFSLYVQNTLFFIAGLLDHFKLFQTWHPWKILIWSWKAGNKVKYQNSFEKIFDSRKTSKRWILNPKRKRPVETGLQSNFGSAPVTSLCVVFDFIISFEPEPVGHRAVLLLLFRQNQLISQTFMSRHFVWKTKKIEFLK